jgi:predicted short-subunit dehydrogenase-like oxidoreductase (DUF2520 family)
MIIFFAYEMTMITSVSRQMWRTLVSKGGPSGHRVSKGEGGCGAGAGAGRAGGGGWQAGQVRLVAILVGALASVRGGCPVLVETGTSEHPARLRVGIIGPGRAGTALARALSRAGHQVTAAAAISEQSKQRVREYFPRAKLTDPAHVLADADLVLLTVPDDVLPGLVDGLAATGAPYAGRLIAHASGAHGVRVLDQATRAGALPLALHPVMTFTGREDDVDRIKGVSFGVTAPDQLRPAAEALVIEMGGEPVFIAEEDRPLYHAALAFAANHLVTLVSEAASLLHEAGADNPNRMLGPLLSAALDNALRFGDAGLTGPVARGDDGTVAAHVAAIAAHEPAALPAYRALARLTADRALAAGMLSPDDAERLLDVLGDN